MINLIKKVDLYSYEGKFTFNDNGETGLKTITGGILSLFSIITVAIFIIYFLIHLLLKEDATILYSSKRENKVNISYSNILPFMFKISDTYSIPIEKEGLYNISLLIWYTNTSNYDNNDIIQYYDELYLEKCDINKHFGDYINYFKKMNDIKNYFCPPPRLNNQSLNGIYGNNEPFLYYNFYFSKCINSSLNNNSCKSENYIFDLLSNAYLDVRYIDYSINNLNKKKVEEIHIRNERLSISISVYKRIWLYLKKINYITNSGLFYNNKKQEVFHQFDSIRIDSDSRDLSYNIINGTFTVFSIGNSGVVDIYQRSFLKVQDYLATIGGITKAISFICYLLNYFNAKNSYYKKIIKDFIIELQIERKKVFSKNHLNSTSRLNLINTNDQIKGSKTLNAYKNNYLNHNYKRQYSIFQINNHQNKSTKNEVNNERTFTVPKNNFQKLKTFSLIPNKLKEKEKFEKKYSISFLPMQLKQKQIKEEFNYYIKMINKRLNIIHVLTILENFNNLDKNIYSNINSSISHSIEYNNNQDSNHNKS